jgi:hypothetical protein
MCQWPQGRGGSRPLLAPFFDDMRKKYALLPRVTNMLDLSQSYFD